MSEQIASLIDHTLLKADATKQEIIQLCKEAKLYSFASVCVNPTWVKEVATQLQGTVVNVCTVIGFPLGASTTATKAFETSDAIANGATEIDMVINIGALLDGNEQLVKEDIMAVVKSAQQKAIVKVIIETALLTDEQKKRACELAVEAGVDFVKTSTGFSTRGATVEDIRLMRATVGPTMGVKASGGVRSLQDVKKMVEAGATRIGASSGVAIMQGLKVEQDY